MNNQIRYAIQLALLNRLQVSEMISKREYTLIKGDLIRKYKITVYDQA